MRAEQGDCQLHKPDLIDIREDQDDAMLYLPLSLARHALLEEDALLAHFPPSLSLR